MYMTYEYIKETINSIPYGTGYNSVNANKLKEIGEFIGLTLPDCNCLDKMSKLHLDLRMWVNLNTSIPKYKWISKKKILRLPDGKNYSIFNFSEEAVELYIKEKPEQTDFILREQPKKKARRK